MKLFNETPFAVGHVHSELEPEQPFLTIVAKGTFRLVPDGVCVPLPAAEQPRLGKADKFKDRHGNSQKSDTDIVPFKPRADCLCVGTAHVPDGGSVRQLDVVFGVGALRKRLTIYGDRYWVREADGSVLLSEPNHFTQLPIREEFSHGGPRSVHNKHGIGFEPLDDKPGSMVKAANIMDADVVSSGWDEDVPSAGFGVVPRHMQPRRGLAGTYDADWQFRRRPLPPRDFDPGFLNASRRDQQVDGFLVGDEDLYFENLHPEHPKLVTKLPGLRVRCFVNRGLDSDRPESLEFAEVLTCLDTCIVDMEAQTVSLVWRGTMEVIAVNHPRVVHMLVCQEPLSAPLELGDYSALMAQKIQDSDASQMGMTPEERQAKIDKLNADGKNDVLAMLKKNKIDPAILEQIERQEDMAGVNQVLLDWVETLKKSMPKEALEAMENMPKGPRTP